ncbi:MAG: tetratricopeptide repeat protein [Planctomycetes bacterium]|nr:tetratricopeptide repeat protein [Planctomycetota bacterium]
MSHRSLAFALLGLAALLLASACREEPASRSVMTGSTNATPRNLGARELALARVGGGGEVAEEIARLQNELRLRPAQGPRWERLGWLFVAHARRTRDEGFYAQAEACARCLAEIAEHAPDALLLRGHVAFARHEFAGALALADELCAQRGRAFDHGLRGDSLLELGRLDEAASAYQRMLDEKPCLQSYARAGILCAQRGEMARALELLEMACKAASPRDAEAAAWAYGEWARHLAWNGENERALRTLEIADSYLAGHAPNALLRARLLAARGDAELALSQVRRALASEESVEARWLLADLLRARGDEAAARAEEAKLIAPASAHLDKRALAFFLATRGSDHERAIELARAELATRDGALARAALQLALRRSGRAAELAAELAQESVSEACDPRVQLVQALVQPDPERRAAHLVCAERGASVLQSSERALLLSARAALPPSQLSGALR